MTVDRYQVMLPAKVIFGIGSLDALGDEVSGLGAKKAFIITDPGVFKAGLVEPVQERLSKIRLLGVNTEGLSLEEASKQGVKAVKELNADIGIPLHLRDAGVPRETLEETALVTMGLTRLLVNNPKKVTLDDVRQILENAW